MGLKGYLNLEFKIYTLWLESRTIPTMPSTTSMRLAEKRSLRDVELAAAKRVCESLSNKSFRLEAVIDDQRRIKVNVETKEPLLLARMAGKTVVCS